MKKHSLKLKTILLFFIFLATACAREPLSPSRQAGLDRKAVLQLEEDLSRLVPSEWARPEAHQIAQALVDQTRKTNKAFKMTGSPKWHNFMVKIGVRKRGYCYHWVPELLKALPRQPMQYYERHWGGSFLSLGRENNAVIITRRGAPLSTGIVYDAWRGMGRPFWMAVSQDKKYPWEQRFSEAEILTGRAKVEPK